MKCIDRYNEYKDDDFDSIILMIKNGKIKSGRYSHLIKIDDKKIMKGKEFFTDGEDSDSAEH